LSGPRDHLQARGGVETEPANCYERRAGCGESKRQLKPHRPISRALKRLASDLSVSGAQGRLSNVSFWPLAAVLLDRVGTTAEVLRTKSGLDGRRRGSQCDRHPITAQVSAPISSAAYRIGARRSLRPPSPKPQATVLALDRFCLSFGHRRPLRCAPVLRREGFLPSGHDRPNAQIGTMSVGVRDATLEVRVHDAGNLVRNHCRNSGTGNDSPIAIVSRWRAYHASRGE
jgi:hypothetical protein